MSSSKPPNRLAPSGTRKPSPLFDASSKSRSHWDSASNTMRPSAPRERSCRLDSPAAPGPPPGQSAIMLPTSVWISGPPRDSISTTRSGSTTRGALRPAVLLRSRAGERQARDADGREVVPSWPAWSRRDAGGALGARMRRPACARLPCVTSRRRPRPLAPSNSRLPAYASASVRISSCVSIEISSGKTRTRSSAP